MTKTKLFCIFLVLFFCSRSWSGNIDPYLSDRLQAMVASENIEILIMMNEQADIGSLDQQLRFEKATLAERNRRVIEALQETATKTQPAVIPYLDYLKSNGMIEHYKTYWIANIIIVTANKAGIEALATRQELGDIYFNFEIESIKPIDIDQPEPPLIASHEIGLDRINALAAWQAGYTGAGRTVANIDTGVDGNHPAFASRFRGDVDNDGDYDESWFDPRGVYSFPTDGNGHGTHTMGTICGRTDSGSDTIGVALDAEWIAAAPLSRGTTIPQTVADALASLQWMINPDGDPSTQDNPDACGNSWGLSPIYHPYSHCDQTFWIVIDNLEAAGTVVIFSAGNEGSHGANTLRVPADRETTPYNVFSVGSVNGHILSLPVSGFSSRGPTYCTPDGTEAFKPEVVAPGDNIRSSWPGGGYYYLDGTSMASPHITGAVAVIRSANPDLDAQTIKEILLNTAVDLGPVGEDNSYGRGIIDLYAACSVAVAGYGYVEGYAYDQNSNPIANALIEVDNTNRSTIADANGHYFLGLPADTSVQTFIASYFGHLPDTAAFVVTAGDTVTQNFSLNFAPSGILHGYVYDMDTNPITGAQLRVIDTPLDTVYTDNTGYYIFSSIPSGNSYDIEVIAEGYGFEVAGIFIPVDDTVALNFTLSELESFELNNGGWAGNGIWEWGAPSSGPNGAFHGNNVWATDLLGNYSSNTHDDLFTNAFNITDSSATFSFYHWYDMENGSDGGNLNISTDNGTSWTLLTPSGGYPDNSVSALDYEPGYTGESNGWRLEIFDLSTYNGETIKMKFRFGSDNSTTYDGWYIDGALLEGGTPIYPEAGISVSSFTVNLDSGQTTTLPLTVSNTGNASLDFHVTVTTDDADLTASSQSNPDETFPNTGKTKYNDKTESLTSEYEIKTEIDPPLNNNLITSIGGPDAFGYRFIDSNEPNGPVYDWIDITSSGALINFNHGSIDDGYTDLSPLGMSFEFYGQVYSNIMISTNGWISFTQHTSSHLTNATIPITGNPNNLIAVQWDDLDGGITGDCYTYYDVVENRFVVSWIDWHYYPDGSTPMHDFQVVLDGDDNSITMQYGDISGSYQSDVTIGIENQAGEVGLLYAYNNANIQTGLVVKFLYPKFWLTVSPSNGSITPGQSMNLDVIFDAAELTDGMYTGNIMVTTNDPLNCQYDLPCTLLVGVTAVDEELSVLPGSFMLAQNYPNPFNPSTEILFGLPSDGHTVLEVFDLLGRRVRTLINSKLPAGTHQVIWDGSDEKGVSVSSGVYFYKLVQGENRITRKMMMLK